MIGYLSGKLIKREADRILLLCGHVGYEVLLPTVVMQKIAGKEENAQLSLFIYYQQTERQPKPVLIGFHREVEKEFFQYFISVEDIGPLKAVRAMTVPIRDIAGAIESENVRQLSQLKGIGKRTAQKIIATLKGKMGKFALMKEPPPAQRGADVDIQQQVMRVLVKQLGHKTADARQMVKQAMVQDPHIATAEELFEAVYRHQKMAGK